MKKISKILVLILAAFMLLPRVMAATILSSKIGGESSVTIGDEVTIPFYLDFNGISISDLNSYGILSVQFELAFDDAVFVISDIKDYGFLTQVYKSDNKYLVYSAIDLESTTNKCISGILHCGTYQVDLTFAANNTTESTATIKMDNVVVSGYQLVNGSFSTNDNQVTIKEAVNQSKNISLNAASGTVNNTTISKVISGSKPDTEKLLRDVAAKINEENDKLGKSDNNYLKSLVVNGYNLEFRKRTYDYQLEIEENVNSLVIDAKLDDETALLEIIGADDLDKNDNQVLINVKAEDGTVRTYTINVTKSNFKRKTKLTSTLIMDKASAIYNEYKLFILGGVGLIVLIIIISFIINKVGDSRLKKKFDNL